MVGRLLVFNNISLFQNLLFLLVDDFISKPKIFDVSKLTEYKIGEHSATREHVSMLLAPSTMLSDSIFQSYMVSISKKSKELLISSDILGKIINGKLGCLEYYKKVNLAFKTPLAINI